MDKFPLVSVIVLNYNNGAYVEDCLQSVFSQTYPNIEILFVENGSTDNSTSIVEKYKAKVKILRILENIGQAAGRNIGLKSSNGELIALMDSDDSWHPKKIELQVARISNEHKLIYSSAIEFDQYQRTLLSAHYRGPCAVHFRKPYMPAVALCGESSAIFTRSLLSVIGYFDEGLNSASGWDFFRRCSYKTNFEFVDYPLIYYRKHSNNLSLKTLPVVLDQQLAYFKSLTEVPITLSSFMLLFRCQAYQFKRLINSFWQKNTSMQGVLFFAIQCFNSYVKLSRYKSKENS